MLHADITGGSDPKSVAWDLDLDGQFDDAAGLEPATALPLGNHLVAAKVTDAAGYESREVTAVRVVTASTGATSPLVVVGVSDTGINPYHRDFSAATFPDPRVLELTANFTLHPSTYIPGYPADAPALDLTLGQGYLPESDTAMFQAIPEDTLMWIPGTKIIGAIDAGDASVSDPVTGDVPDDYPLLDEHGHGTASASVAVGNVFGFCPTCLLVVGESFDASHFMYEQSWIDIASNSWGNQGNVGTLGLLLANEQPKEMAEAGQLALYAAGNGVENGFIVPEQTYLSEQTGPDWQVRVGAVERSTRKPIVGTGKPVDVSSFGDGVIPSADAHSENGIHNHSGTSAATPYTAGVLGTVLRTIRGDLGDTRTGPRGEGVLAQGPPIAASPSLADGVLTRTELTEAVFKTAEHDDGDDVAILPTTTPNNPVQFAVEGYGLVDDASGLRAVDVLRGVAPLPDRTTEDTFFAADEALRDALWGDWAGGGEDSSATAAAPSTPNPLLGVTPAQVTTFDDAIDLLAATFGPFPLAAVEGAADAAADGAAETYYLHYDSECDNATPERLYMDHADTAGDQDACTSIGTAGIGGEIGPWPSDDENAVTVPAGTEVDGVLYVRTVTPAPVEATATLVSDSGLVGSGSSDLQLTFGVADDLIGVWVPLGFTFPTQRAILPGDVLTLSVTLDSTVTWQVGYEDDHASFVTLDVPAGGGGGPLSATITTPEEGAVVDPALTPSLAVGGTYSFGDLPASPAPTRRLFPRRDECSGDAANARLESTDGPDGESSTCGFVPGASVISRVVELRYDYPLVAGELPISIGAGQVSGTMYVVADGPSPIAQLRMELSTVDGPTTKVIGAQSVGATVTGLEDVVPFPFSFPVDPSTVDTPLDDLTFSIVWEEAQGGIYVSVDGDGTTSYVDIPVTPTTPLDGVQVAVDDAAFTTPAFATLGTDGTWGMQLDVTTLDPGDHVVTARAVRGGATSTPVVRTIVVESGDPVPDGTLVQVLVVPHSTRAGSRGWVTAVDTSADGDWSRWHRSIPVRRLAPGPYDLYARLVLDGTVAAETGPVVFTKR